MAKKQKVSLIPLVLGVFLLFLLFDATGEERAARPSDDGDQSNFRLIFDSMEEVVVEDEPYWVRVVVHNQDNEPGEMWVQCSILDADEHVDWLSEIGYQSTITLGTSTRDNCVLNEEFTQTAKVELDGGDKASVRFSMIVPQNSADKNMQLVCDAFEQCWEEGESTGSSSTFKRNLDVLRDYPDGVERDDEGNVIISVPQGCTRDSDCPGHFFPGAECYQGHCLDSEDVPSECGDGECTGSENSITCAKDCGAGDVRILDWLKRNKIVTFFVAFALIIVGIYGMTPSKKDLFEM